MKRILIVAAAAVLIMFVAPVSADDGETNSQEFGRLDLAFTQKAQQHMLRLNIRGPKLAGFITSEEDRSSGFLV